jgi:hypothetical protein
VWIARGQMHPDAPAGLPDAGPDLQKLKAQGVDLGRGQEAMAAKAVCIGCAAGLAPVAGADRPARLNISAVIQVSS